MIGKDRQSLRSGGNSCQLSCVILRSSCSGVRTDLPLPGDVLSSHKAKDDAWSAFLEAIEEPSADIHYRATRHSARTDHPRALQGTCLQHDRCVRWLPFAIGPANRWCGIQEEWDASLRDRATQLSPLRSLAPCGRALHAQPRRGLNSVAQSEDGADAPEPDPPSARRTEPRPRAYPPTPLGTPVAWRPRTRHA